MGWPGWFFDDLAREVAMGLQPLKTILETAAVQVGRFTDCLKEYLPRTRGCTADNLGRCAEVALEELRTCLGFLSSAYAALNRVREQYVAYSYAPWLGGKRGIGELEELVSEVVYHLSVAETLVKGLYNAALVSTGLAEYPGQIQHAQSQLEAVKGMLNVLAAKAGIRVTSEMDYLLGVVQREVIREALAHAGQASRILASIIADIEERIMSAISLREERRGRGRGGGP